MNILFYIFYLICLFLPGETIFQLCFPRKKHKLLNYSILEHIVIVIVLGLCFSTIITFYLSLEQQLSVFTLVLIDILAFLPSFILDIFNKKLLNKHLLIFRLIDSLKNREKLLKKLKENYILIIVSSCFIIFFVFILYQYQFIPNEDIWRYTEWAVDLVNYQPDIFQTEQRTAWYLGSVMYTNIHSFFLATMILGDITSWEIIIKVIIPVIGIVLLMLLIIDFARRVDKKYSFVSIIVLSSTQFLMNWFFYALPTSISILCGILAVKALFNKKKRSYLLFVPCVVFQYVFHTPTLLLFAIGIILTIVTLFFVRLLSGGLRTYSIERIKAKWWFYLLFVGGLVVVVGGGAVLFFTPIMFSPTFFERALDLYSQMQAGIGDYELNSAPPAPIDWILGLAGPHILLLSLISIIFVYKGFRKENSELKKRKIDEESKEESNSNHRENYDRPVSYNLLTFFWLFALSSILISAFLPIWYWYTTIPYLFYRYFIYVDLAFIFLAPFVFYEIIKILSKKEQKRYLNKSTYTKIFKISFIAGTLVFSSFHFLNSYNLNTHYQYVPEGYLKMYHWARNNTANDSLYVASPDTQCSQLYYHPIMHDRIFVEPNYAKSWFVDSKYVSLFNDQYYLYLTNLYSSKKLFNLRFAYANSTEEYTRDKLDYVIVDDLYNPYLVNNMIQDTMSFDLIRNETNSWPFSNDTYKSYLFYYKDFFNYFKNSRFELGDVEWFLSRDLDNITLERSSLDPHTGGYSLLVNNSFINPRGYIKSNARTLSAENNYFFSCYFKFLKVQGEPPDVSLRFYIRYVNYKGILVNLEPFTDYTQYLYSESYYLVNNTFSIDPSYGYFEIEIEFVTSPQRNVLCLIDNIILSKLV